MRILPVTQTNASNAFLQFCSGVVSEVQDVYDIPEDMREALNDMAYEARMFSGRRFLFA